MALYPNVISATKEISSEDLHILYNDKFTYAIHSDAFEKPSLIFSHIRYFHVICNATYPYTFYCLQL